MSNKNPNPVRTKWDMPHKSKKDYDRKDRTWEEEFKEHPNSVCQICGNIDKSVKDNIINIDGEQINIQCCSSCAEENKLIQEEKDGKTKA